MNKLLEQTIDQAQKMLEQSKDLQQTYEEISKMLTENKTPLDQFYKQIKRYEAIQFYLADVPSTLADTILIQARYQGQPIADISISKEETTISTKQYNENNKKIYGCDIQLEGEELNTKDTYKFLEFFNKEISPKGKIDEQAHINSMLLQEFAKTSSYDKLLTGIQPIKYSNLFYPIPIILNSKEEEHGYIDILTRTKVRKLTIIETLTEKATPEMILTNATSKAIFLLNLLHTEQGQQWYKIMGFHGRVTPHLTIKVCIAVPKQLANKCKKFEPFELRAGADSIEYHYMSYDTDGAQITKIDTTLNE